MVHYYTRRNSGNGQCGSDLTPQNVTSSSSLSADQILALLKTVDGTGSGLDADLLDGYHAAYFVPLATYLELEARVAALEAGGGGGSGGAYLTPTGDFYITPTGGHYLFSN